MQKNIFNMFLDYSRQYGMPDIIHAHNSVWGGVLGAFLKKKTKLPLVLTEHSSGFSRKLYKSWKLIYAQKAFRSADVLLAVSESLSDNIKQLDENLHVSVLGNIVSTDYFQPAKQLLSKGSFTITSIGFLQDNKNFGLLIHSFGKVLEKEKKITLNIIGNGDERNALENLTKKLNLEKKINFLGHLERAKVRRVIQKSHIIVSSSNVETFGVTLIEALSCGKPVIATRSGGPEDFVTEENGILVPVNDIGAMTNAILKMRDAWAQYNPEQIRAKCIARFGENAIVGQLESIYRKLLE